jgi:hypothetical protein
MSSPPPTEFHPQTTLPPTTLSSFKATTLQTQNTPPTRHYPNTTPQQAINMHMRTRRNNMVETRTTKPTLMTRLRGRNANSRTVKTTTKVEPRTTAAHHHQHTNTTGTLSRWGRNRRTAEPVVHHRRHASIGDKISGAMLKLKGSLTHRPGVKVCSTLSV